MSENARKPLLMRGFRVLWMFHRVSRCIQPWYFYNVITKWIPYRIPRGLQLGRFI